MAGELGGANECVKEWNSYKGLDNSVLNNQGTNMPFIVAYTFVLADGTTIGFRTSWNSGGCVFWGQPSLRITVDVNGKAGPNKLGRDVFFFYLGDNGKILPYRANGDDCEVDKQGTSCAYRVLNEGGMNY